MSGSIKENITRRGIWLRLVFMIVLSVAFYVARFVTFIVVAFQFLASLFAGQPNDRLSRFGRNLARYLQQITVFMTFATEDKPFPFAPWPDEPDEEGPVEEDSDQPNGVSENAGDATEIDEAGAVNMAEDTEATDTAGDADKPKD